MAGKLCFGSDYNNAGAGHIRSSVAFCEGVAYRASGTALAAPKTDNPHVSGSEAADAWDAGWDAADADAGGAFDHRATCCGAQPDIQV